MKRLSESERSEVWDRVWRLASRLRRWRGVSVGPGPRSGLMWWGGVPPTGTGPGVVAVAAVD